MAETITSSSPSLKGLRAQMAAAAQAQAQERRSLVTNSSRPTGEAATKPQGCQPVINGATLRTDDRLRVAKERREEADRQQAIRGSQIMERERKAKMQVERQLEERQKKVEEQRRKEEQRRVAVEEKRRQKQEEEKEHYEAVMRRSVERSQRSEQRQKRWSWGGSSPHSDASTEKRSSSSVSMKQSSNGAISKRLSSSSAAILKSPDQSRAMKTRSSSLTRVSVGRAQMPVRPDVGTPEDEVYWPPGGSTGDGRLYSRLFTPTQASLARSAATLSTEGTNASELHQCPRSVLATPNHRPPHGPLRSRSSDRQKSGNGISPSADTSLNKSMKEKPLSSPSQKHPASPSTTSLGRNRSPSPNPKMVPKRTPSPSAVKHISRSRPPSPVAVKQCPPQCHSNSTKTQPIQKPPLTPTGATTLRKRDSRPKDMVQTESKTKEKDAETNAAAAEATKILAQNRRLMREQKEKEEQQRLQREEEEEKEEQQRLQREKKEKEEQQRLQLEEEKKRQQKFQEEEEEKRFLEEEEKKRIQEEKRLEEDKLQQQEPQQEEEDHAMEWRMREQEEVGLAEDEAMRQSEHQKEREEAKAQEEAQRVREERNRIMEQNQQERLERRKRIEEIMKRTRKGESNDVKREEERSSSEENREAVEHTDLQVSENDQDKCDPSAVEHLEAPLNGTTEEGDTEEKENSSTESKQSHTVNDSRVPKDAFIHDSGLNGKSNQWSFGDLIDAHTRSEDQNQVRISREGSGGGTKGSFGDPENLIKNMCAKPSEAI